MWPQQAQADSRSYHGGHYGGHYGGHDGWHGHSGYHGGYRGYYSGYWPFFPSSWFFFSAPAYPVYAPAPVVVERPVYQGRVVNADRSSSLETDLQVALRRKGYYRGPIDGDIGPGTRAAIRAYQRDQGMRETGTITNSLLERLGL